MTIPSLLFIILASIYTNAMTLNSEQLRKEEIHRNFLFTSKRLELSTQNFIIVNYEEDNIIHIHTMQSNILTTRAITLSDASDINQFITPQTRAIIYSGKITAEVEKSLLKGLSSPYSQVINIYFNGNQYMTKNSISYQLQRDQLKPYPYHKAIQDWPSSSCQENLAIENSTQKEGQ